MKTKITILCMSLFSLFGLGGCAKKAPVYPTDTITLRDGSEAAIRFFGHASLAIGVNDRWIYVDPVSDHADYSRLPKAGLILITHHHGDHFDRAAVEALEGSDTEILCDRTTAEAFDIECITMRPGSISQPCDGICIEAVAAYNTSEGHLQFHPREREDCGYILSLGGTRIYIAGDTEPTPEMKALHDIDIAFLPVNQPYTMTVEQAVEAIEAFRPAVFYPYHYGQVDTHTDLDRLAEALRGVTEVRIRPME